jgi:hypothetical protein
MNFFTDSVMRGPEYEHRALAPVRNNRWPFKENTVRPVASIGRGLAPLGTACPISNKKCLICHGVSNAGMNWWDPSITWRWPEVRPEVWGIYNNESGASIPVLDNGNHLGSVYGARNFHFPSLASCVRTTFLDTNTQTRGYNSYDLMHNLTMF